MSCEKKIRLGILGCAKIIENAIVNPLKYISNIELYAIASRDYENAKLFSEKYSIKIAHRSYEELIADPNIDFVYIALTNDLHIPWAIKAAEAKKHILVEKPLCIDVGQLKVLEDTCWKNNVYLLEAMMVQHHEWQSAIKQIIDEGMYGILRKTDTRLSFIPKYDLIKNYRSQPDKGGGSFYDMSPYWLQFLQSFRDIKKAEYDGNSQFNGPNKSDVTFDASLQFPDGMIATFEASFEKPYQASHTLIFDNATLFVEDMFRAITGRFKIALTIKNQLTNTIEKKYFSPSNYYENQLNFFTDVMQNKKDNVPIEQSFERIDIMTKIYQHAYAKIK
jgi:predicted dehydrogenase